MLLRGVRGCGVAAPLPVWKPPMLRSHGVEFLIIGLLVALCCAVLAFQARRSRQRAAWDGCALLVVVALGAGYIFASRTPKPQPPQVLREPAPVPAALTLVALQEGSTSTNRGTWLTGFHARDGSLSWQDAFDQVVVYDPEGVALSDTTVYLLGADYTVEANGVWALRAADGALLWHTVLGSTSNDPSFSMLRGSPVVVDGLVYVRVAMPHEPTTNERQVLYALRVADGRVAWKVTLATHADRQGFAAGGGPGPGGGGGRGLVGPRCPERCAPLAGVHGCHGLSFAPGAGEWHRVRHRGVQ
jgi:hypothetical protein